MPTPPVPPAFRACSSRSTLSKRCLQGRGIRCRIKGDFVYSILYSVFESILHTYSKYDYIFGVISASIQCTKLCMYYNLKKSDTEYTILNKQAGAFSPLTYNQRYMRAVKHLAAAVFGPMLFVASFVFADALSISVQSPSPAGAVPARTNTTFTIVPSGFSPYMYVISDAFGTSSVSNSNISGNGGFSWTPIVSDIGTHPLTITASDNVGNAASTTAAIVVAPPPSLLIQSLVPGQTVMPAARLSFTVI